MMSALRLTPIIALLTLAACATTTAPVQSVATAPTALDTWTSRIRVQAQADEIRLAAHATGLSGNQARALSDFHVRWMQAEGGAITIAAPNSGDTAGAYRVSSDARAWLIDQGAPANLVRIIGYDATGAQQAPVIVAFQRYVADIPTCGSWTAANRTMGNEPQDNFGCAVAANLAAQVANPEDLARARGMDPADPGRRSVVLGKYRNGEVTSSAKDDQASAAVSNAIQ